MSTSSSTSQPLSTTPQPLSTTPQQQSPLLSDPRVVPISNDPNAFANPIVVIPGASSPAALSALSSAQSTIVPTQATVNPKDQARILADMKNQNKMEEELQLDNLFTKINYNNEMIKLYQIDQLNEKDIKHKEFIDKKIQELINDRNILLNYLNELYDKNTTELNLTLKLNVNDRYIKDLQEKEIKLNNEKINEFNNLKMNKDREYEILLYDIEYKKTKTNYLFWSLVSLIIITIILILKTFNLINNILTFILILLILVCYFVYFIVQISINNNRNNRYYDKYNFTTPTVPEEQMPCEEEKIISNKPKTKVHHQQEEEIKNEEESKSMSMQKNKCLDQPTLSESELKELSNPLSGSINI